MKYSKKFILFSYISVLVMMIYVVGIDFVFAESKEIDFILNVQSKTKATPFLLYKPGIDLSGRGFHKEPTWPQNLAAPEALAQMHTSLDLKGGIFRIQFDLWEFFELADNKQMQAQLLHNYSDVIKEINAAGGVVILTFYGMPPGLGKVLDKKSSSWDIKAFKGLLKEIMYYFSREKGYDVWYEVWSAPDIDEFFLGQQREYLDIYQAAAESAEELEKVVNHNIRIGAPAVSWWFQNIGGNTILLPEKSLIYELIRYCSQYKLPLDFISWYAYTSDQYAEHEKTPYKKNAPELIREWLSYFGFDATTPLVISEWNFDAGLNFESRRGWESYIAASFIPSRLIRMQQAGIDYQVFFCLEDFKDNKQGVNRNVGLFWYESDPVKYIGGPKSMFNVIRMLNMLGSEMYLSSRVESANIGIIATQTKIGIATLFFNYIDPEIARNYLSRNLGEMHPKFAKTVVQIVESSGWQDILGKKAELQSLRLHKEVRKKLESAIELNTTLNEKKQESENINYSIINLKEGRYIYKKFVVDDESCRLDCVFSPVEKKELNNINSYQEVISLKPYSVVLVTLEKLEQSTDSLKAEESLPKQTNPKSSSE